MTEDELIEVAVNRAIEKMSLLLPTVVAQLLQEKVIMRKMADEFYNKHKEFIEHKKVVASVIEQIESQNPGLQYSQILDKSVPEIKERISIMSNTNIKTVEKPTGNRIHKTMIDNGAI